MAVADIGAGTIDLAMFNEGSPFRTSVLPVGGNFVTNDIAIGIKTSLPAAEELKVNHGTCDLRGHRRRRGDRGLGARRGGRPDDQPRSSCAGSSSRGCARRSSSSAPRSRPAARACSRPGLILTGGGAQLAGVAELGREVLQMPVRVVGPTRRRRADRLDPDPGLRDERSACSSGAPSLLAEGEPTRYESAPADGVLGRLRSAVKSMLP